MAQQNRIGTHRTTVTVSENGSIIVSYHQTKVFIYNRVTGDLTLNTGGYFTATTKTRMNQACDQFGIPVKVYQKNGDWYATMRGVNHSFRCLVLALNINNTNQEGAEHHG